jgi:GT2 family glycosyltransferase
MFSFIVLYRNRDIERVRRCLQSIEKQTYQDFEVIFLDYGSEPAQQTAVENLCKQNPKIRYVYANTRGLFWCRSHALNLGVAAASRQYMIIVDIDIIYCPHFAAYLVEKVNPKTFFNYACYYLPENYTDYKGLDYSKLYDYKVSDFSGAGLLIVAKETLNEVNGFDTIFKVWGFEDIDMYYRLRSLGYENERISIVDLPTFHQWHQSVGHVESMPKSWLEFMRAFWETKPKGAKPHTAIELLLDITNRPALQLYDNQKLNLVYQSFEYPLYKSYLEFTTKFQALRAGESMQVKQSFEAIPQQAQSFTARFFKKMNQVLEKFNISYRVTEILVFEKELIEFFQVRDFIFYFLYAYEAQIADYYWKQTKLEMIEFIVVKK